MKHFLDSLGAGFAGLLRFSGRDSRVRFWPYAALIFFFAQLASTASVLPALRPILLQALGQLSGSRIEYGPGYNPIGISSGGPDLAPAMRDAAVLGIALTALTILLLAAAVARRLHDRDLRGYWGLLPLPFLGIGFLLMPRIAEGLSRGGQPDMSWLFPLFANNLVYFAALGWLIYLLAGPGTPGANRFGPPPAQG